MRITLLGFGTVGRAFATILRDQARNLVSVFGLRPQLVAVVDSRGAAISPSGLDIETVLRVKAERGSVSYSPQQGRPGITGVEVLEELDTDVVIETTPTDIETGGLGLTYIETALRRKCHVITTNKGPLAVALPALMEQAAYNGVLLRFSGTVGGGTPILTLGKHCLNGDRLLSVQGILNGTTNFILSKMAESGTPLNEALREAQDAGYAEADPTYDVEGIDAAAKLVIIANWLMDRRITIKDVDITGILGVTSQTVREARRRNEAVKLICSIEGDAVEVKPRSIPITHPLCVGGTLNAVTFRTEYAGEITIVGHGAGGVQTAGAVLRDLIDIRMHLIVS